MRKELSNSEEYQDVTTIDPVTMVRDAIIGALAAGTLSIFVHEPGKAIDASQVFISAAGGLGIGTVIGLLHMRDDAKRIQKFVSLLEANSQKTDYALDFPGVEEISDTIDSEPGSTS